MSVPLEPLRQLATEELGRLCLKYPRVAEALDHLKRRVLSRLEGGTVEYDSFPEILENIVRDADELENQLGDAAGGCVLAISQELTSKLENLAKAARSQGVDTLPELKVKLSLESNRKMLGREARKRAVGNRTKFGGSPDWIQNDATPVCTCCKKAMTFIGQIDSLSVAENALGQALKERGSYMFGDAGMVYVFWCGKCNTTGSVLQCS